MEKIKRTLAFIVKNKNLLLAFLLGVVLGVGLMFSFKMVYFDNMRSTFNATGFRIQELSNELKDKNSEIWNLREDIKREETSELSLIDGKCNLESCAIKFGSNHVVGIASIEGYYTKFDKSAWGEEATCDALVVTGGNEEFINELINTAEGGNYVNSVDSNGNLVLTLGRNDRQYEFKEQISASIESRPIKLTVFRDLVAGGGAPVCYSFVKIMSIRDN